MLEGIQPLLWKFSIIHEFVCVLLHPNNNVSHKVFEALASQFKLNLSREDSDTYFASVTAREAGSVGSYNQFTACWC